jgi:hypothetical protein
MIRVRQEFPQSPPLDVRSTIRDEFQKYHCQITPGMRIAVAVGSRGIANLPEIVSGVLESLKAFGAQLFILPAMGSHGGATPEGQIEILESLGISETAMTVSIRPSMDVKQIGSTPEGAPIYCGIEALNADGVVLVNRIKPHTDFSGSLGSGIMKMSVVGLGKHAGAAAMHMAAARLGHERVIRSMAGVVIRTAPILCGVAILENQFHETAKLAVLPREEIESGENQLFNESRKLMPTLPFDEIDLLIVDRIGKNISGAGMDPNVTGRWVDGYLTSLARNNRPSPFIRRIFVRDLTIETHGNAIGIGLADATTSRVVRAMDRRAMRVNALTALTPNSVKIPITFDNDREAIEAMLRSLAIAETGAARVVRISDTSTLAELEVSEALLDEVKVQSNLTSTGELRELRFDPAADLVAL